MGRRLRSLLAVSILAILIGGGWAIYQRATSQIIWRIAVAQHREDDEALFTELARWMATRNRRSRFEIVRVEDEPAALEALRQNKADILSVRADTPVPGAFASIASLYREVAAFIALPRSGIDDWAKLKGKTIGLIGHTSPQDRLVQRVLRARNLSDVKLLEFDRTQFEPLMKQNAMQAVVQVAPLINTQHANLKIGSTIRKVKREALMLEVTDADALASVDKRYVGVDVPAGGIREAPALPEEETATLAVTRHLVVLGSEKTYTVQRLLIDIMDAKRAISSEMPLARNIGSPGTDKDGVLKVHPAAAHYFNGDEMALPDLILEWIYLVPLVIGGCGAAFTWAYNLLWPASARRAQFAVAELMKLRRDLSEVKTGAELNAIAERLSKMQEDIDRGLANGGLKDNMITALLVASDAADRKLEQMRERFVSA